MNNSCYNSNQINFKITKKNSGKFEYTNITWDFNNQLELKD